MVILCSFRQNVKEKHMVLRYKKLERMGELMPKISVIVPVYNVQEYLTKCVDSILIQDFRDFELILIDDGVD